MGKERTERLHRASRVMPRREERRDEETRIRVGAGRAAEVLWEAEQYWLAMERFRTDRERNKKYTYGQQWDDYICVDGERMREEEYIRRQGNVALKNNLIRRMVQAVLGVYRSQAKEPTCKARDRSEQKYGETMNTLLQYNMQRNQMGEVNARSLEEFLISGFAVQRKWYGWKNDTLDCWTETVNPNNFFIDNNMRDSRGWDASCLGEIHDVDFNELCSRFAHDADDYRRLEDIYGYARNTAALGAAFDNFGQPLQGHYDFLIPSDPTRCRYIEVWRKESKPRLRCRDYNNGSVFKIEIEDRDEFVDGVNRERLGKGAAAGMAAEEVPLVEAEWMMDCYWKRYCLTPFGDVLEEGETPYEHKGHPYVFKAYPFIDGEIHSFVSNVIDQQRYVNRLITMYDWIMRASAKGVLLFPEDCIPTGMTMDDIADEWARFNGVIMIRQPKTGTALPQQIANNSTQIGITELLNMQLKFMEEITGVNGAIQGKPGYAGMSASLYNQQTQNATTSLLDILETYSGFVREGATKDMKNIQQYYDEKMIYEIAGRDAETGDGLRRVKDIEFDLSIVESTATPVYRTMANEILMKLLEMNKIGVEQMLEFGDFPFADKLLQSIQSQKAQLSEGRMPAGLPDDVVAEAQAGADMDAAARAEALIGGRGR